MNILALDLGKFKTVGCEYDTVTGDAEYEAVKTTPFSIHQIITRRKPDRVVWEVGPCAGWVHDVVEGFDAEIQVANPSHDGWRWRNVKAKSDRLDALKLARLSAVQQLPQVHIPSHWIRQRRSLIAYRQRLVAQRTQHKNRIRSILHSQGRPMLSGLLDGTETIRGLRPVMTEEMEGRKIVIYRVEHDGGT